MKPYKYRSDIITQIITHNKYRFYPFDEDNKATYEGGTKLTQTIAKQIYEEMTEDIYLIKPDPMNVNLTILVYELENVNYFYPIDTSRDVQRPLQKQYKEFDNKFKQHYNYKRFMKELYCYEETKILSKDVVLSDGYIYNFDEMEFRQSSYEVPAVMCTLEFEELTTKEETILDTMFNQMYPTKKDKQQFFYYILCNLEKTYVQQSIFLVIDTSGVGKNARIIPMVKLGLNRVIDKGLLKSSELYNIMGKNSVIANETQTDNNISGSDLNNIADTSPLTVTVKHNNAIDVFGEDKPLLQIMGESLPFLKEVSNGTNRRFLLVPKVDDNYLKYVNEHEEKKEIFYGILYDKPIQMIQYYVKKIKEYKIFDHIPKIKESMGVTLKDLEDLLENKEVIYGKYMNLHPLGKYDECYETRYLIQGESLDNLLEYIDYNIITTSHFNTKNQRRNFIRHIIKENLGVDNIFKELNKEIVNRTNYSYAYCLTPAGVELAKKINNEEVYANEIEYYIKHF